MAVSPGPIGAVHDGSVGQNGPIAATFAAWCGVVIAGLITLYWTAGPWAFADHREYIGMAERLAGMDWSWFGLEGVSRGIMRRVRLDSGSSELAVGAIAVLSQAMVVAAVIVAARTRGIDRRNLLLVIAFLAPLMSLVTYRATPAYLLCTAGLVAARLSRSPSLVPLTAVAALALLFHNSAVFVLAAVLASFPMRLLRQRRLVFLLIAAMAPIGLIVRQSVDIAAVISMLRASSLVTGSLFDERVTYLLAATQPISIAHIVYFLFVTAITYRVVVQEAPNPTDPIFLAAYVLYCMTTISPVVSVRVSHFFVAPLILTARRPLVKVGDGIASQLAPMAVATALVVYSVYSVFSLDTAP